MTLKSFDGPCTALALVDQSPEKATGSNGRNVSPGCNAPKSRSKPAPSISVITRSMPGSGEKGPGSTTSATDRR